MSEVTGSSRPSRRSPTLSPVLILLLGLLTTAVCMLLLYGPFYMNGGSPGAILRRALFSSTVVPPFFYGNQPRRQFFLIMLVVFGVVLALLPWLIAAARQSARRGTAPWMAGGVQVTRTERDISLSFVDDGSIVGDDGGQELTRSVDDLQMMAGAVGIPWHADYETAGGARAFLEVLRAVHSGPSGVIRAEDLPATREGWSQSSSSTVAAEPTSPQPETSTAAVPAEQKAAALPDIGPITEPAPTLAGAEGEGPDLDPAGGYRISQPTWSSSFTGSVYTSTDLYRSERTGSEESDDAVGSDDSDDGAGER